MRLSRPCYDKPWRCPGWTGGGARYAKVHRCDNGRVRGWDGDVTRPHLRFLRCNTCDVVTLPYALRWLDPSWLRHHAARRAWERCVDRVQRGVRRRASRHDDFYEEDEPLDDVRRAWNEGQHGFTTGRDDDR